MEKPQVRQDYLFDVLRSEPSLSFGTGFSRYLVKFGNLSQVTFNKDWKKAQARLKEYRQTLNAEKLRESIKHEKEAVKRKILDKLDALELLSEIITNENNTTSERINAVKELAKMQGFYEPDRIETTNEPREIIFRVIEADGTEREM